MPSRFLQVLVSVVLSAPLAPFCGALQAEEAPAPLSDYDVLRLTARASRVDSPEQVRELRASLAGHTVEIAGRAKGILSSLRGRVLLLECTGRDGQTHILTLAISPELAEDAASMRALRAEAPLRILARVNSEGAGEMLSPLAATNTPAPTSLFRDEGDEELLILSPVSGALPEPQVAPQSASSAADATAALPASADFPASLPLQTPVGVPTLPSVSTSSTSARPSTPRVVAPMVAPRAFLAPRASSVARAVPSLPGTSIAPLSPSILASAQKKAPARKPAPRARVEAAPADEPILYADDPRIESQLPAYTNLVRRFNKKLSADQVEEIGRALLSAGYAQNMDPRFLAAIIAVESDFDIYCLSSSGAMGLGQIMPFNLPEVGMTKADAWNPTRNVHGTAKLLRGHLNKYTDRPNGTLLAVAAYNAGDGAVRRAGYKVPPGNSAKQRQTQRYVWKVYYRYKEFAPELFR